jgi:metallo-beta-lactamase family protein
MPRIAFHGAARTVTGSKHLLTLDGRSVLVDCGLFQGPREIRERNWQPFGFEVEGLDAVIATHAHQDHIGLMPKLFREGYRGPIYATPGTINLARISLPDSARLQEEEARSHNRHGTSRHRPAEPLFTEAEAYETMKLMRPVHYFQWQELGGGATFRFLPAGHILGSAYAEVYFASGERILMGGDLGRWDQPIIRDPAMVDFAEYVVVESTYGDRLHPVEDPGQTIADVVNEAVADGRCVLVPSFAIGRTQELLWHIHRLVDEGRIPQIPIYVDSPMATSVTDVYTKDKDEHDADMKAELRDGHSPFGEEVVKYVRDRNMSKALNDMRGPFMVISGSGMANGGRVIHHLKHRLDDPSTLVLFTGYQAEGTLGRRIVEGEPEVTILGERLAVRAEVRRLESLSAHADQGEIMRWLRGFKEPPRKTFIVHGEPAAQNVLRAKIESELGWVVEVPEQGQEFEL